VTGRKVLFAVPLLLLALAPAGALAADVKAQSSAHLLCCFDPFQGMSQGDLLQSRFASSDPLACVHNGWYAAHLLYESPDESATEY
jgi:hypothetical protein